MGSHTKFSKIRNNHENVYSCFRQPVIRRSLKNEIFHKIGRIRLNLIDG